MSRVSVVIPCYRYAHFLPECVASVLAQPGVDVQVLILDDASPDDTPGVAAALAAADSRVSYRRHATNLGHIATHSEGLALASGDYTVLLSADDLLTPGSLARAAGLLDAHPTVGFVYGGTVPFTSGQPRPPARTPVGRGRWRVTPGRAWFRAACQQAQTTLWSPEVMVRTSLQHELGGYRADLPHTADQHTWLSLALRADVGRIADADQAYYRLHPANMHKTLAPTRYHDLRYRQEAFEAIFQEYGERLANAAALRREFTRGLARAALRAASAVVSESDDGPRQAAELIAYARALDPHAYATPEYLGLQLARLGGRRFRPLLRSAHRRFFHS